MIHLCQDVFPTPFFVLKKVEEAKYIIKECAEEIDFKDKQFEIERDLQSANHYINYYKKIVEN